MKKLLDTLSFPVLIIMTLFLGSAPLSGQPHLLEKINMLLAWQLSKPLDIFDLVLHSAPIILLILKTVYYFKNKSAIAAE